jgi:phosphatidyl-myo-inositol dimannoside synthase
VPRHLLVTNDFPPKVGGIQSYLWELWRRLDPASFSVLTASSDSEAPAFDAACAAMGIEIVRVPSKILFFPTKRIGQRVEREVQRTGADLVIVDPAFPLGSLAQHLSVPCVQILHGAEVTIPGRLPLTRALLRSTLRSSAGIIAAGPYPEQEGLRLSGPMTTLQIPPGVDTTRFVPLGPAQRSEIRQRFGIGDHDHLVVSVSRLVPRKGMDTLIKAAAVAQRDLPSVKVLIGGSGRDAKRLARLITKTGAPVELVGRVDDDLLPGLIGAADLMVMACRNRWLGLEQEGFGIVFLEAASCEVPQIAGRSGGAGDAVRHGETGVVLSNPRSATELARQMLALLQDPQRRAAMGRAGRQRALASYDYDVLAHRLGGALKGGWPRDVRENS